MDGSFNGMKSSFNVKDLLDLPADNGIGLAQGKLLHPHPLQPTSSSLNLTGVETGVVVRSHSNNSSTGLVSAAGLIPLQTVETASMTVTPLQNVVLSNTPTQHSLQPQHITNTSLTSASSYHYLQQQHHHHHQNHGDVDMATTLG